VNKKPFNRRKVVWGAGINGEWEVCFPQSAHDYGNNMVCRVKSRGEAMRLANELNKELEENGELSPRSDARFGFRKDVYADLGPEAPISMSGPLRVPKNDPVHIVRVGEDGDDIECLAQVALAMKKYPMILLVTGKE
jgi:hypothetical protein